MKKLLYLLIFISYSSFSQDYGNKEDAIKLCTAIQSNNFSSDTSADNALERILGVIGASKRFVLQPCDNINNAVATSFKGIRYILYDRDFMNTLDGGSNWGNLFILAHEVGHHINGHSLDILLYKSVEPKTLKQRRQQELEADEFAGFVLAKLGGSLDEANQLITSITNNSEDSFSTHPSRSKRLTAVGNGYKKATNNKPIYSNNSTERTAEDYFYSGYSKYNLKDFYGAIADYTKSIEIIPDSNSNMKAMIYFNRGSSKGKLKDYYGAIADYTRAIEIDPNHTISYLNRGYLKRENLKDYYGAIADFTKAIEISPNYVLAYGNRAEAKNELKDYYGAIADYTKAIEIEPNDALNYKGRGGLKDDLKDYNGAIADFSKAIEIEPNNVDFYCLRGYLKLERIKDYYGAIADFSKAIEINPNFAMAYVSRGTSKLRLEDFNGAIADFTKAIENNPNDFESYYIRALLKVNFKLDEYGAMADYTRAIEINPNYAVAYFERGKLKKDYNEAIKDFTKAIEINPNDGNYYWNRALSKYYIGDKNGACQDSRKAKELVGGNEKIDNYTKFFCN